MASYRCLFCDINVSRFPSTLPHSPRLRMSPTKMDHLTGVFANESERFP